MKMIHMVFKSLGRKLKKQKELYVVYGSEFQIIWLKKDLLLVAERLVKETEVAVSPCA
jgi:hypothetical protein